MKNLLSLLVFALSTTLFWGCQEEENAYGAYDAKPTLSNLRLGDGIKINEDASIPEIDFPGKALLTAPLHPGNLNQSASAMLVLPRLPIGPRPKPCICEPLPQIMIEEPYRFDPEFDYTIYVTDRESGKIIRKLTEFSMGEDLQSVYFSSSVEDLLVPSGATALSVSTSIIVEGKPVAVNFPVSINPETLPRY